MFDKIDPYLQNLVNVCDSHERELDCIVYTQNINYLRRYFDSNSIGEIVYTYPFISALGVKVKNHNLFRLARLNFVTYITASTKVNCLMYNSKKLMNIPEYNIVKNSFTCAIIDTGLEPNIDMSIPYNNVVHFKDFVNGRESLYDDNGHGTFVASVLSSSGVCSCCKYSGVVDNQKLVILKALSSEGETDAFTILNAFEWIYKNHKKYDIKVVCMSFGSTVLGENDPLILGAEALWDIGITVVVAAGNSGPSKESIKSPGASRKLITVGALDTNNINIADFSSRGPILNNFKPDLVAPGVNIVAGCNYKLVGKEYSTMSGTSVSTPMIAGIVCLLLDKNPSMSPNAIKRYLTTHAVSITGDRNKEGYGYIDYSTIK